MKNDLWFNQTELKRGKWIMINGKENISECYEINHEINKAKKVYEDDSTNHPIKIPTDEMIHRDIRRMN
jgi:hypothetical protein